MKSGKRAASFVGLPKEFLAKNFDSQKVLRLVSALTGYELSKCLNSIVQARSRGVSA
jgi:hypothetical protein